MILKHVPILLFIIVCLGGIVMAQDDDDLIVRPVDNATVQDNDTVTLDLVVLNDNGTTVNGLEASQFTVSERTQSFDVSIENRRPLAVMMIVNASVGSDIERIRQTLNAYFENYYQPGDIIEFYILDANTDSGDPREASPDTLAEINEIINGITPAPVYINLGDTFDQALAEAESIRETLPDVTVQTVYVAPYLNRVAEADTTRVFANANLPFHVVQVHEAREDTISFMRQLAENGGGLYVNNQAATLLDDTTPLGELRTLYDLIAGNRIVYRVAYRPENPTGPEPVTQTLTVRADDGRTAQFSFTYEGLAENPIVELVGPPDLNFSSIVETGEVPLREVGLRFQVTFPDGNPRDIERLELRILDARNGSVLQFILDEDISIDDDGIVEKTWSIGDFAAVGTFTPITLVATITDALGFEAPVQRRGSINWILATPAPTRTPVITATPTIVPTETPSQVAARDMTTAGVIVFPLLAAILLLGLLVVFLRVNLWRQRARLANAPVIAPAQPPPSGAPPATTDGTTDTQPNAEKPDTPDNAKLTAPAETERIYGRLYVLEGLKVNEIIIDREEFIIGRSINAGCHYEIPEDYIHPQHCMFMVRGKSFVVRDLGGKNGTFVDERRIDPNGEVVVPFKARINITRRIRLQLRDPSDVPETSQREDIHLQSEADDESEELRFRPFLPRVEYPLDDAQPTPKDYRPL